MKGWNFGSQKCHVVLVLGAGILGEGLLGVELWVFFHANEFLSQIPSKALLIQKNSKKSTLPLHVFTPPEQKIRPHR